MAEKGLLFHGVYYKKLELNGLLVGYHLLVLPNQRHFG